MGSEAPYVPSAINVPFLTGQRNRTGAARSCPAGLCWATRGTQAFLNRVFKKAHTHVSGCTWEHKAESKNSAPLTLQQTSKETLGQFDFEPKLMVSAAWQFRWNLPERPWNFTKKTGQYPCYPVMPVGYLAAVNVLLKAVCCDLHNRILGIFKWTNILLFSSQPETHPTRKTK